MQQRYPGSPGPSPQDDDDDVQVSENGTDSLEQLLPSICKSGGGCGRLFFLYEKFAYIWLDSKLTASEVTSPRQRK